MIEKWEQYPYFTTAYDPALLEFPGRSPRNPEKAHPSDNRGKEIAEETNTVRRCEANDFALICQRQLVTTARKSKTLAF